MSRSKYRGKQFKEWWGRRPYRYFSVSNNSKINKFFKRQVHKVERQEGKKEVESNLD